ncbi:MAG: LCP family protein [Chloroflexota bacterium]|nr:LCP family protein [Chloroflexota bacterium]
MDKAKVPVGGGAPQPLAVSAILPTKRTRRIPRPVLVLVGLLALAGLVYIGRIVYPIIVFEVGGSVHSVPTLVPATETAEAIIYASPTEPPLPTPLPGEPTWTPRPTSTPDPADALPPGRINILLLGTDNRAELGNEASRSDTLIILSLDPKAKTAGILSIPRDLWVPVPGHGLQKINAAYFYGEYEKLPGGGITLALPTVRNFFKVPIDYYAAINFDGFEKVIDEIGGIDVYLPEPLDDDQYPGPYNSTIKIHFNAGCQHLNGTQALQYARTRHADSDFGRARRQQQVIRAVREKALELNMLPNYPSILEQLGNSIETNITLDKQAAFAQLAGEIKQSDIYSAQIDSTLVTEQGADKHLVLDQKKAKPLLDWFFGRGKYAGLRPGATLTPEPTGTATAERSFRKATPTVTEAGLALDATATDGMPAGLATGEPTAFATLTKREATVTPPLPSPTAPPLGQCR